MILIHFILRHKELCYMHKYVIGIHYILHDANIWCYYFKEKGLILWPCSDLRSCARLANQEGKTKGTKKNFMKRPSQRLWPTYLLWWHDGKRWMSYLRHTTSSKSNINHFIINHCSDPCLQIVHNIFFSKITGLLSLYNQSSEKFSYWTPWIGQPIVTKNS